MCYSHNTLPPCPCFLMVTQTDIPSDLTDNDKAFIFQFLDSQLNSTFSMHYCMVSNNVQISMSQHIDVD